MVILLCVKSYVIKYNVDFFGIRGFFCLKEFDNFWSLYFIRDIIGRCYLIVYLEVWFIFGYLFFFVKEVFLFFRVFSFV